MKKQAQITQKALSQYLALRTERLALDARSRELAKEESRLAETIQYDLECQIPIQAGTLTARMKDGGRYPAWKREFEAAMGIEATARVVASTIPVKVLCVELKAIQQAREAS